MGERLISPIDCTHPRPLLVQSEISRANAYSELVIICPDCGRISVRVSKNGVNVALDFELSTSRLVEATGRYLRYLEATQAAEALQARKKFPRMPLESGYYPE